MKVHLYQLAAQKAVGEGNVEEARRIVDQHITDPYMRSSLLSSFDQQLIQNARQASRIQEARALASRLRTKEERAMMLAQLASDVSGDKNLALQLLDEARDQIGPRAETATQFNVQLQLVQMYAPVDPARGFRLLQPMVERFNELVTAAAVLDGFDGNQHFRDGELQMNNGGTFASLAQQCGGALGVLANADFDRARLIADGLQRDEARLSARFMIAQTVLSSLAAAGADEDGAQATIGSFVGQIPPPPPRALVLRRAH
jgi:hypothetical protein